MVPEAVERTDAEGRVILPFVSREAYNAVNAALEIERRRVDALTQQIAELRRDGFQAKPAPIREPRELPGTPDLEEVAQEGAKREFIEQYTKDLIRQGHSEPTARAEAERMASTLYETYGGE